MASRRRGSETINSNTNEFVDEEKIASVMQIIETMEYPELLRLRDLIGAEYTRKAEAAKIRVIAEAREKFEQLGFTFEDVVASLQKRKRVIRAPAMPKYRSPDGKEWSGRGVTPKWIREFEESGGQRDDYLIKTEG